MDFRGRGNQNAPVAQSQSANRAANAPTGNNGGVNQLTSLAKKPNKLIKYSAVVLLFAVTALVIALTFLLAFGNNSAQRMIQKDKYQAVFLNNGQVYFGHITSITDKNYDLQGIYYLQTNGGSSDANTQTSTSATNVSLVKLGCELHAPYDQMLINADQVLFWENLQDKGQVVQAINKYKTDNKTQTCSTTSQNSTQQAPSTSSTQSSTGGTTSTTNTSTSTGTTKKQ